MTPLLSFLVVSVVMMASSSHGTSVHVNHVIAFEAFKKAYGRVYASQSEESERLKNFVRNLKEAERQRRLNPHATFGVNGLSDLSREEFKLRHNAEGFFRHVKSKMLVSAGNTTALPVTTKAPTSAPILTKVPVTTTKAPTSAPVTTKVPATTKAPTSAPTTTEAPSTTKAPSGASFDWREHNAVTYVKDQGNCASCWSFSATGNLESMWAIAGNPLIALSEQELVSCVPIAQPYLGDGCAWGDTEGAWQWLMDHQGGRIASEAVYPYVSGATGTVPACRLPNVTLTNVTVKSWFAMSHDEASMAQWLAANGPISVGVDADNWRSYTGGVLTTCGTSVDHSVLIVGFNDAAVPPYWIVKNSWGAQWGLDGYIHLQKGVNLCNILEYPFASSV